MKRSKYGGAAYKFDPGGSAKPPLHGREYHTHKTPGNESPRPLVLETVRGESTGEY